MFTSKVIFGVVAGVCILGSQADAQCFSRCRLTHRVVRVSPVNPCCQSTPVYRKVVRSPVYYHTAPQVVASPAPCCGAACGGSVIIDGGAGSGGPVYAPAPSLAPSSAAYSRLRDAHTELQGRVMILESLNGVSYP